MSLEHALLDRLEKRSLQIEQQKNEIYGLRQLVNEKMTINAQLSEQITAAWLEREQMQHQISELRTECDRIRGEHEEAVTAARENGIHKGESLSGFIWRQCEGLRKSQAENAPLNKLFVVLCKQRGNLNEEIIYRAVDEASDAIKKLTA